MNISVQRSKAGSVSCSATWSIFAWDRNIHLLRCYMHQPVASLHLREMDVVPTISDFGPHYTKFIENLHHGKNNCVIT